MKPPARRDKSASTSEELSSQRPKRSTCQKSFDNRGISWREETDLKKALYASLQETRKRNLEDEDEEPEEEEEKIENNRASPVNGTENETPKKVKVHAQRKFAQGSTPTSPIPTPQKVPNLTNSTTELIPYRRPKTEDFLTFLCLRGTSILPPSLDFLNCCSKSDSSSECRSLSPDLDVTECSSAVVKRTELKDKSNIKNENIANGVSKKHTACKASSKRHPNGPNQLKKSNSKSQKEVSVVKKRKSRDENDVEFIPSYTGTHSSTSGRTRASTLNALREKYKKQRLAAGKKKNVPSVSENKPSKSKPSDDQHKSKKKAQSNVSPKNQNKATSPLANKLKSVNLDKKLAIEKRKSLRSAHFSKGPRRKAVGMNKKTMWLRRAKLVPPIVDVDSDSEPEVLAPEKKSSTQKSSPKSETDKRSKRNPSSGSDSKNKIALTSRQILLRKHMQNRLKAKKSVLHTKNIKSKSIAKRSVVKQHMLRRARKSVGLKPTMSLRKDHQNKRVTRSAKQQIEEMLWANPEKRTRGQLSKTVAPKSLRKRNMPDAQPIKKPRLEVPDKGKDLKHIRNSDNSNKQVSTCITRNIIKPHKDKHPIDNIKQFSSKGVLATNSSQNVKRMKTVPIKETMPSTSCTSASTVQTKGPVTKSKIEITSKSLTTKTENTANAHRSEATSKVENKLKNEKCDVLKASSNQEVEKFRSDRTLKLENETVSKGDEAKVINKNLKPVGVKSPQGVNSHHSENGINISKGVNLVNVLSDQKNISQNNMTLSKSKASVSINCMPQSCNNISESAKNSFSATKTENSFRPIVNNKQDYALNNFISSKEKNEFERKVSKDFITSNDVNKKNTLELNRRHSLSNEFKELNVQNNLNISKIEKTNDKDISKLMTLNVEHDESFSTLSCKPSTSTSDLSEITSKKISFENSFGLSTDKSNLFKKHNDKKYIKKAAQMNDTKLLGKSPDKRLQIKNKEKSLKSPKVSVKGHINKKINVVPENNITNLSKCDNKIFNYTSDSDSFSSSEELGNFFKKKDICISEIGKTDSPNIGPKPMKKNNQSVVKESSPVKNKELSHYSCNKDGVLPASCVSPIKEKIAKVNEKIKNMVINSLKSDADSDESDCELTLGEYLKLSKSAVSSSSKHSSLNVTPVKKEIHHSSSNLSIGSKSPKHVAKEFPKISIEDDSFIKKESEKEVNKFKKDGELLKSKKENEKEVLKSKKESVKESLKPKKESEKELQKMKKEGTSSKHKKDKESKIKNHDKSSKKDDKLSKKDPEKSLAKLLKKGKDRLKSSKKEEKSKHKKDGSCSSKSSKREFDKDGSKLKKELEKDNSSVEKLGDKRVEFLEVKKDKSSKKESSKVSRSNSLEETKSPKKKKKYNEFKDIEKIKNLISNSSILNEIPGFKAFKRRLSGDKLELKKRLSKKKQKKLALLKEKKLSKKLSSKLLRKYSKKKGLKSKKSKLKKKGLKKELKMSSPNKIHSKNKKQKRKEKDHHQKDNVEKPKPVDSTFANVSKLNSSTSQVISSKTIIPLPFSVDKIAIPCSVSNVQTSTCDIGVSADFQAENMAEVIPAVETAIIAPTIAVPTDLVFKEIPAVVTTDYTSVIEEGSPKGAVLLATRDNVSQVPVHIIQDTQVAKLMADAATNTCEEDIDEVISSVPEHLRNDEMSVGTQTMTPTGSPSPTLENRTLLPPNSKNSILSISNPIDADSCSKTNEIAIPVPNPIKPLSDVKSLVLPLPSPSISKDSNNFLIKSAEDAVGNKQYPIKEENILPGTSGTASPINSVTSSKKELVKNTDKSVDSTVSSKKEPAIKNESASSKIKKRTASVKKQKIESSFTSSKSECFPLDVPKMVSAPTYYPTSEEFRDPLEYISKICPEAEQFGICKIVPPSSFKPECKVNDDLRFTALNQYLHKMLYRWGPNVQHTACIRKHLKSQKVKLEQSPLIGGIELDLSKFFHTVQQFGGLQQVIEKKRWQKVADALRVPKAAQDRVTKLYDAYCKYLVSYDLLPLEEKQKLEEEVIAEHEKYVKLRNSKDFDRDEEEEEENSECVTKGRSMALSNFFRIARNTMSMWFKNDHPTPEDVEPEFWKIVTDRNQHVVVHAGNIDSNTSQSGFPSSKSAFAKHPWNLKVLTNSSRSILKSMGPVSGITSPTLHVGMLFTTSCWYRDPHSLPWIEYLHTGASKIWYGIPANGSEKFKNAMKNIAPECCIDKPLWLSSESSMIPPDLLIKNGSSLTRTIQKSGQFVVIFPESFTSTICCGYCVSESVYFAPTLWLDLAEKAFQDIHNSCESPAFSLERLLFSIANEPKPQLKVLQKILPMIESIRSKEMSLRAQLNECGLTEFERLPVSEPSKDRKKKLKSVIYESEPECEICSTPCYLSRVFYSSEDTVYCLPHALEHLQQKNFKQCKIVYAYDEKDFDEIIKKIEDLVSQLPNHTLQKKTLKKKPLQCEEK